MIRLLHDRDAGRVVEVDVPVALNRIPKNAAALRSLAERIRVVAGLRLLDGDTDPIPISGSFAAYLISLDPVLDKSRGGRLLSLLEKRGVIREAGSLPPRGQSDGTKCYLLVGVDLEAVLGGAEFAVEDWIAVAEPLGAGVERDAVSVEVVAEPLGEVDDESVMHAAVAAGRDDLGVVAPRCGTASAVGLGHDANDNRPIGSEIEAVEIDSDGSAARLEGRADR